MPYRKTVATLLLYAFGLDSVLFGAIRPVPVAQTSAAFAASLLLPPLSH